MRRPAATIVVPAWNEWQATKQCLASLQPTLGVRDTVVVVDNGSTDGTAAGLARHRWLKVVTNPENRGFAAACNQGAAEATGEVIVFLNNDTLVTGRWIDSLLRPFQDAAVVATGPRSNMVSGPQVVDAVDYRPERLPELHRFTKAWAQAHRDEVSATDRLVGFCLAVRADAFQGVGGFDESFGIGGCEDDDLCTRLKAAGGRLVIAHEAFVHHEGHRTFDANGVDWEDLQERNTKRYVDKHGMVPLRDDVPTVVGDTLLSACLIVRDEEEALPSCLAALDGVVDEIVVYDTGSTDRTVEIARDAGATVVEGHWDDDFARARNTALDHCHGDWILHVDADELLDTEAVALRQSLQRGGMPDGLLVRIDNVDGEGIVRQVHQACRIFRRARAHWLGRIHEQVVARPGQPVLDIKPATGITIRHSGYAPEVVAAKGKASRNLRIASLVTKKAGAEGALGRMAMGQAAFDEGDDETALDWFEGLKGDDTPVEVRAAALRHGAESLLRLGRAGGALEWVQQFRKCGGDADVAGVLEGMARSQLGDHDGALACFVTVQAADDSLGISEALLAAHRGLALIAAARWDEAVDALLDAVASGSVPDAVWAPLAEALWHTGRDAAPLAVVLDGDAGVRLAGQLLTAVPAAADHVAEGLWAARPGDVRLVALATRLGARLPIERALVWSTRVREAGVTDGCPLLAIAADDAREPLERVWAAACAASVFADERAAAAVTAASGHVAEDALTDLFVGLDELAPNTLGDAVVGAATTPGRSLAVARVLRDLGAPSEAAAVLIHGFGVPDVAPELQAEGSALLRELTAAAAG